MESPPDHVNAGLTWRWATIGPAVLVLDILTKLAARQALGPDAIRHQIPLIGEWLALQYVENRGAAFGMLTSATSLLAAVSLIAIVVGAWIGWITRRKQPVLSLCIMAVLGGAVGNLLDRLTRGFVVDFISVGSFPTFNIADSAITVGMLGVIWLLLRDESGGHHGTHHTPPRA